MPKKKPKPKSRPKKIAIVATLMCAAAMIGFMAMQALAGPVVATQQLHQAPHRVQYTAKFMCGLVPDSLPDWPVAVGEYRTSLNVRNNTESEEYIDKHISVIYADGQAMGREPDYAMDLFQDSIMLPAHSSTMDDCARIYQLTGYLPGTFIEGFFEFNAFQNMTREMPGLVVVGVYTTMSVTATDSPPSVTIQRIPNDYSM